MLLLDFVPFQHLLFRKLFNVLWATGSEFAGTFVMLKALNSKPHYLANNIKINEILLLD